MKQYQYRSIHTAITAVWGNPSKCELCHGKEKSKRFEWSSKTHKYTLERDEWWQLCARCHRIYDREKFGHITWNKGLKGRQPWHNTKGLRTKAWNKGMKTSSEVKVKQSRSHMGKIPWNKGIKQKDYKSLVKRKG